MPLRTGRPHRRTLLLVCMMLFMGYLLVCLARITASDPPKKPLEGAVAFDPHAYKPPSRDMVEDQAIDVPHHQQQPPQPPQGQIQHQQPLTTAEQLAAIDRAFCNRDKCRFMLPILITEQESKAQLHFRQLAFVAGKLDRIMVLPNVHSSHLGACRQYAFDYYYDLGWLDNNKDAFSYISMERFLAWTAARRAVQGGVPSAQEISIELPGNPSNLPTGNCLADQFDFSGRPRYDLALEDPESKARRKTNYLEVILSALSDKDNMHVPANLDVVHLYFDRRFAFMSDPRVHVPIDYHARWRALANDIAQQLHPYVAVHWRMEMLEPVSNMVPCAQALVEKIQGITNGMDAATNVFLLTDYPHLLQAPGARPESMSFKVADLHQDHHDAIKYLYDHVNVTLTTVLPQAKIPTDSLPPTNWNLLTVRHPSAPTDRSVLGIIDKLVAIQADWFLYGYPMVCGKASSFTRRIQYDRAQNPQAYQLIADTFNFHAHK